MKRRIATVVLLALTMWVSAAFAQEPQSNPVLPPVPALPPPAARPLVPLEVQVVIARYNGEKKVSSLPYSLAVNANDREMSRLRMGSRVPVATGVVVKNANGQPGPPPMINYQDIGTNIDCQARTADDGRYQLTITVEDSSVYNNTPDPTSATVGEMPVFRSFKSTNTLVLRDGQSRQFTAATDRVSGDVVKIDVTLKVVK